MEFRIIVFVAFFTFCSFSFGQVNRYNLELVKSHIESGSVTTIDTLQVKKRIEEGIKKYGKENVNQVLVEMLYDDLKKMADKQAPNPMDVLYDKMIQDLSDEAQGKENNAIENTLKHSLIVSCKNYTTNTIWVKESRSTRLLLLI